MFSLNFIYAEWLWVKAIFLQNEHETVDLKGGHCLLFLKQVCTMNVTVCYGYVCERGMIGKPLHRGLGRPWCSAIILRMTVSRGSSLGTVDKSRQLPRVAVAQAQTAFCKQPHPLSFHLKVLLWVHTQVHYKSPQELLKKCAWMWCQNEAQFFFHYFICKEDCVFMYLKPWFSQKNNCSIIFSLSCCSNNSVKMFSFTAAFQNSFTFASI